MKVTVELDKNLLREVSNLTGMQDPSRAVSAAVREFLHMKTRQAFLSRVLAGEADYSTTNDEIEASTQWDDESPKI